jgi:hypothetical protein
VFSAVQRTGGSRFTHRRHIGGRTPEGIHYPQPEINMDSPPNKFTGVNTGGPRQSPIRMGRPARIIQFRRSAL